MSHEAFSINVTSLLWDNDIEYWTSGKNVVANHVNIRCPLCDDHSNHGSISLQNFKYKCWRCGPHNIGEVFSILFNVDERSAWKEIFKYKTTKEQPIWIPDRKIKVASKLIWPVGIGELLPQHKAYLLSRNFDPDFAVKTMGLKGTGGFGDWSNRIIIPIFKNKKPVAYQGRTISKNPDVLRYKFLKQGEELYPSKYLMYGLDKLNSDVCLIVEGVWEWLRFRPYGRKTIATLGTSLTEYQIADLVKSGVKKCFILFDWREVHSNKKAKALAEGLSTLGISAEWMTLGDVTADDPAELSESEAKYLMNWL